MCIYTYTHTHTHTSSQQKPPFVTCRSTVIPTRPGPWRPGRTSAASAAFCMSVSCWASPAMCSRAAATALPAAHRPLKNERSMTSARNSSCEAGRAGRGGGGRRGHRPIWHPSGLLPELYGDANTKKKCRKTQKNAHFAKTKKSKKNAFAPPPQLATIRGGDNWGRGGGGQLLAHKFSMHPQHARQNSSARTWFFLGNLVPTTCLLTRSGSHK